MTTGFLFFGGMLAFGPSVAIVCWLIDIPAVTVAFFATVFWAVYDAHRLRFSNYDLMLIRGPWTALFGCLLLWLICFPVFLYNRLRVTRGKAVVFDAGKRPGSPWEPPLLLFSIGLLGLLCWGMIRPEPWGRTRIRFNEAAAVTALKQYDNAQQHFLERGLAAIPGNTANNEGYCGNFRNLHYGRDENGEQLFLVGKAFADAFGIPPIGGVMAEDAPQVPTAHHGYFFFDDPYVTENNLWKTEFGLFACPGIPGETGGSVFWIGEKGLVYYRKADIEDKAPPSPEDSPLHPEGGKRWRLY